MKYLNNLKQQGFSIIEIMIALVIGMVLLGGAVSIFISNNSVYRLESELSRMQESGRFLIDIMSKEIRMAGFSGCSSRGTVSTTVMANDAVALSFGSANAITGYDYVATTDWEPDLPSYVTLATAINASVLDNTDVMNIQRGSECGAGLTGNMASDNAQLTITVPNGCSFSQQEVVMITDCATADVLAITNSNTDTSGNIAHAIAAGAGGNSDNKLSKAYGPDSQIYKQLSNTFYVANGASGEPALWLASWNPSVANDYTTYELADGVEQMQLLYGLDTGGGNEYADAYVEADDAALTDWTNVRSVRISLLLRSADNITTQSRAFTFNGANANTGNDKRLRMLFSTTVTLRNRLP